MLFKPRYIFKYRTLDNDRELSHCKDIILNHRLFMPTTNQLNDPMESGSAYISLAVPGATIYRRMRIPSPLVEKALRRFRILSLTEKYDSPQMWANYAGNYSGICFAFSTHGAFKNLEPVIYTDKQFVVYEYEMGNQEVEPYLHDSLLFKKKDWSNEYEWRIIKECEESEKYFFSFEKKDFAGVIIGKNVTTNGARMNDFLDTCKRAEVRVWKAVPTYSSIYITPLEFKPEFSGATIEEQIENAYRGSQNRPPFI